MGLCPFVRFGTPPYSPPVTSHPPRPEVMGRYPYPLALAIFLVQVAGDSTRALYEAVFA